MFERDLAYRKRSTVNWCSSCATVLDLTEQDLLQLHTEVSGQLEQIV